MRRFHPDVVFLDLAMPRLWGYEVARRIRQQPGGGVPLIALSGWGQSGDISRSREVGFDKHLVKPVTLKTLKLVLATIAAPGGRV